MRAKLSPAEHAHVLDEMWWPGIKNTQDAFSISEEKTGVFIVLCNRCDHVIAVLHRKKQIEQAKGEHTCWADAENK